MLIKGRAKVGTEILKNPKAFIYYSQKIDDVYENLEGYNPTKKKRVLIVFDDMTEDMESNKKRRPIATELFLRGRKLNHRAKTRSFSGPYFPVFGLHREIYKVNLHIQFKFGKIRTRKTPYLVTFLVVNISLVFLSHSYFKVLKL